MRKSDEQIIDEMVCNFINSLINELEKEVSTLNATNRAIPEILFRMERTKMVMKNFYSKYPKVEVLEHIERMEAIQNQVYSLIENATTM